MTRTLTLVRTGSPVVMHPHAMDSESLAVEMEGIERELERLLGYVRADFQAFIRQETITRRYRELDTELKRRDRVIAVRFANVGRV